MKKLYDIKLTLTIFLMMSAFSLLSAQTLIDQEQVLQKCVDIPALQKYYSLDNVGNPNQLHVINYLVSFPANMDVSHAGHQLVFLTREEISANKIEDYFIFRQFEITGGKATVNLNFFYDYNYSNNQFKILMVSIELDKVGSEWSIITSDMKGDIK